MFDRKMFVVFVCAALAVPSIGALLGRDKQTAPAEDKVDVAIALKVAGRPYNFSGKARCNHAPSASIYEVNGQLWKVEHNEGPVSVSLTFWRPADGSADMFTLHCKISDPLYVVSTVKTKGGGTIQGAGKVTFAPSKSGGTFTIDAAAANGAAITGTIKCSAFLPIVDEGG